MDSGTLLEGEAIAETFSTTRPTAAVTSTGDSPEQGVDQSVDAGPTSVEQVDAAPQNAHLASREESLLRQTAGFVLSGPALPTDSTGIHPVDKDAPWLTRHRRPLIGLAALCPLALLAVLISWLGMNSLATNPTPGGQPASGSESGIDGVVDLE